MKLATTIPPRTFGAGARGWTLPLLLVLLASAGRAAEAAAIHNLNTPAGLRAAGAEVGAGVREVVGPDGGPALAFSGGAGVTLPLAGRLTARSGGVDLWIRVPAVWPPKTEATLLHLGESAHTHLTMFFRQGVLVVPYKPDEDHYLALTDPRTQRWAPESWHRIQLTWQPAGERDVALNLRVDGETVGVGSNRAIGRLPERLYLGQRGPARQPWLGALQIVSLSAEPLVTPELQGNRQEFAIETGNVVGQCHNFWSIANTTSQYPFADPAYHAAFKAQKPYARMVNCVRLLGGRSDGLQEWFQGVDAAGRPICDFSGLIAALRGILQAGYTPRLVLDNVPTAMSAPGPMHTYGNTQPPQDYALYHAYIQAATAALIEGFGREVVAGWRFRVMTEPDLKPGHWAGTKEEWLRLYDTAVDAVTRLLPEADIGPGNILNPAKAGGKASIDEGAGSAKWGLDIIDHCAVGRNYHTGARGTRMRYFSSSWYGRVGEPLAGFELAVQLMRERLARYPQFQSLPVEIAEFCVLNDERGRRLFGNDTTEWGGSFLAAIADRAWRLDVRQIHQWGVNSQGLPTPYTHVLGMLERMAGGDRLVVTPTGVVPGDESGAVACRQGDAILILAYHHRPASEPKVSNRFAINLRGLAGTWTRSDLVTDAEHGVFMRQLYRDCEAAGLVADEKTSIYDANPATRYGRRAVSEVLPKHRDTYARLASISPVQEVAVTPGPDGAATIEFDAPAHSVRLIELRPASGRR